MSTYNLEGPKWAGPVVTWSFADPTAGLFTAAVSGAYRAVIQQAFQRWDDVTGLSFQQVADGSAGADIKIGWWNFGVGASTIGTTRFTYMINGSAETFQPGVSVQLENPAETPLTGALLYGGTVSGLYQVALHEIGHALGLDHTSDRSALMYPVAMATNRDLAASDLDGIHALYGAPAFNMTNATTGVVSYPDGSAYSGPVSYLQHQFIYAGTDNIALAATLPNSFLKGGSGNDALSASSGQNVLDGGTGSNFLSGGTGSDTFFIDGRGGQESWGTITNFAAGDSVTLWGYTAGLSSFTWADNEGAAGFTGRTLHADLSGQGTSQDSITFAGLSGADTARFSIATGTVNGLAYLQIRNAG